MVIFKGVKNLSARKVNTNISFRDECKNSECIKVLSAEWNSIQTANECKYVSAKGAGCKKDERKNSECKKCWVQSENQNRYKLQLSAKKVNAKATGWYNWDECKNSECKVCWKKYDRWTKECICNETQKTECKYTELSSLFKSIFQFDHTLLN